MDTKNPSTPGTETGACATAEQQTAFGARVGHRGFTLVELMMVIVIVAIIATIALPGYQQTVRASRRADAVQALQQIQILQERLRAECNSYAAGLDAARVCNPATPANNRLALAATSPDGLYTLALSGASSTGYTATATAVAGTSQAADVGCTVLTLAVVGQNLNRTPAECWTR